MRIIPRAEWGFDGWLRGAAPRTRPRSQIIGITLHYNGPKTGGRNGAAVPRSIHRYHKTGNGWAGIGYHFLGTQDGTVYEGRGLDLVGAHSPSFNVNRLGYQIYIGDNEQPSDAAKRSFLEFKAWAEKTLGRRLPVNGHRDGQSTSCPGGPLYQWIKAGLPAPGGTVKPTPTLNDSQPLRVDQSSSPWWGDRPHPQEPAFLSVTHLRAALAHDIPRPDQGLYHWADQVWAVQRMLTDQGHVLRYGSYVAGHAGSLTRKAIESFQRALGHKPDGWLGPRELAELVRRSRKNYLLKD